jgi:hypothetical protein
VKETEYIWLASYPKSGNTWVRMMLNSLALGGAVPDINDLELKVPIISFTNLQEQFGVEATELTFSEIAMVRPELYRRLALESGREVLIHKVHDQLWRNDAGGPVLPKDRTRGVVYLVRDPRDVAVSAAAFFGTTLDAAVDILAAEKYVLAHHPGGPSRQLPQRLGGWSTHVTSWLDGDFPLLLVRYEDLLRDPVASLRKIVEFLGMPAEHVEAAVAATHFDQLARQEQQQGFRENPHANDKFFRSGKAGEGKLRLTPGQLARIETAHGTVMKRLGYL